MIIYALIVRTKDGMALTATTDYSDEVDKNLKVSKRFVKQVAMKAFQFPDRCTFTVGEHNLHFVTALGITYIALCEKAYPPVLAFSFLNELMKEFISKFESVKVNLARRPYSFIEFDNFIHKARQRYNQPQSLSTRVNLSDLSAEIKLRPPYILNSSEIEPIRNGYHISNVTYMGEKHPAEVLPQFPDPPGPSMCIGPPPRLEPLTWYAIFSILPSACCVCLAMYRACFTLANAEIQGIEGLSLFHVCSFLIEGIIRVYQLYLLLYQSKFRIRDSWCSVIFLLVCVWLLWDLRDALQKVFFVTSAIASHIFIITRRVSLKLPEHNV